MSDNRCLAQALLPGGYWKRCIRDDGHTTKEPHVWLEAFSVVSRLPIVVTWYGTRTSTPTVSTVHVGEGAEAA